MFKFYISDILFIIYYIIEVLTMAIVQCENKHYYDNVKYNKCPFCQKAKMTKAALPDEGKTVAKFAPRRGGNAPSNSPIQMSDSLRELLGDTAQAQQSGTASAPDEQKTVALYMKKNNMNPVSGWIVCIEGENRGRSFEVHIGKNFAGRSMKSDIHLNDTKISRENHFTIVYDPLSFKFFLSQGKGVTYINDKLLSDAVELTEGDKITAGASTYLFVPFCKEGRDWNEK